MAAVPPQAPPQSADEITPQKLAELWKKQGGFDSLRKQLLADFLASPDRDALLTRLDTLLPLVFSQTPSLPRLPRKDRPATALSELKKRDALKECMDKLEVRLRATREKGTGTGRSRAKEGRRVERELANTLRRARGVEGEELESEESEEEEAVVVKKEETAPPPAPSHSPALVRPIAITPSPSLPPASASPAPTTAALHPDPALSVPSVDSTLPGEGAAEATALGEETVQEGAAGEDVEMKDAAEPQQGEEVVVKAEPVTA
ncbi:hypothetical protein JCM6882_006283 [Rhodosporidiobolus microsporus]